MATLERHAAGGSVAVFEAGEFFSGGTDGFDGCVVGGGVLAEDVVDGLVEDGPGFEVGGDVNLTPELKAEAMAELPKYRLGPLYTPPSFAGTLMSLGRQDEGQ